MRTSKIVLAAAAAAVIGTVAWAFGVEPAFSIGWGLVGGAVALLAQLTLPNDPGADAPHIDTDPDNRATEIARMAWALNPRTGLAGERVVRRVRAILTHRLQRIGLDPEDPADRARCDAVIGRDLWDRLTEGGTTITDVERALDAIDRLSPTKEKK